MPRIKSSAGDTDISLNSIRVDDGNLVIKGKMGVWDADVVVTPKEALSIARMMLSRTVVLYVLRLPYLLLTKRA
jgi:hypothetical protein